MIKTIIVDDEENARKSLISLLNKYSEIEITDIATNGDDAISKIIEHSPDIVFLDIKMPSKNGFEVLDFLKNIGVNSFSVIILTAYEEFAIKAIKYNAFDYLLKPVDPEELHTTILKVKSKIINQKNYFTYKGINYDPYQKIKAITLSGYEYLDINDIVYVEGDGNYTVVIMSDGEEHTICKTLKDISLEINRPNFIRVHKSFLINKRFLIYYNKIEKCCILKSNNEEYTIPVSTRLFKSLNN